MERDEDEEIYLLGDGHIIEAVDRVYVALSFIEESLGNHALLDAVPAFSSEVMEVKKILSDLYQQVGQYDTVEEVKLENTIKKGYEVGTLK